MSSSQRQRKNCCDREPRQTGRGWGVEEGGRKRGVVCEAPQKYTHARYTLTLGCVFSVARRWRRNDFYTEASLVVARADAARLQCRGDRRGFWVISLCVCTPHGPSLLPSTSDTSYCKHTLTHNVGLCCKNVYTRYNKIYLVFPTHKIVVIHSVKNLLEAHSG